MSPMQPHKPVPPTVPGRPPDADDLLRAIARNPSYRAPGAADVHDPAAARPPELPRMSANERRLLDAVVADPNADEPRLAYAAWADIQGDHARAVMIREQVGASQPVQAFDGMADTRGRVRPSVVRPLPRWSGSLPPRRAELSPVGQRGTARGASGRRSQTRPNASRPCSPPGGRRISSSAAGSWKGCRSPGGRSSVPGKGCPDSRRFWPCDSSRSSRSWANSPAARTSPGSAGSTCPATGSVRPEPGNSPRRRSTGGSGS